MTARLTFIHALSPLHAGTGQGAGVIDLPIAREKATGLPFLPGSSLKGPLRASLADKDLRNAIFGPETLDINQNENYASSVQFSDQRLLLLPVRSLAGTFAWVTSPFILRRLLRDMEDVQQKKLGYNVPTVSDREHCIITDSNSKITLGNNQQVYLEDLNLIVQTISDPTKPTSDATLWANWIGQQVFQSEPTWQQMLNERFCIVHDDVFNFIIDTATEITARIRLRENSKTVEDGGLWYEEALPAETILSGIVLATPTERSNKRTEEVLDTLSGLMGKTLQLGGKATVGRGMCRVLMGKEQG